MKAKVVTAIVLLQLALFAPGAWAEGAGDGRPHISDVGGDDHSPGVTAVIFITLLFLGFGMGFIVGRRTRTIKN